MSEDINSKLKLLTELFEGKENLPDNLKNILAALIETGKAGSQKNEPETKIPAADDDRSDVSQTSDGLHLTGGSESDPGSQKTGLASYQGKPTPEEVSPADLHNSPADKGTPDNTQLLQKLSGVMEMYRADADPRINLLRSVEPFLGGRRRQKLQKCISILQMGGTVKLFGDGIK